MSTDPHVYETSESVTATEGDGGTERDVPMAPAMLVFDSVPVTVLCTLFALFIQQTLIGSQLGIGDMAMNYQRDSSVLSLISPCIHLGQCYYSHCTNEEIGAQRDEQTQGHPASMWRRDFPHLLPSRACQLPSSKAPGTLP